MRVIILKYLNIATKYSNKFIISVMLLLSINTFAANSYNNFLNNISFINQNQWETSITPILNELPTIDNGDDIYGGRFAVTHFFFNYKNTLEIGLDASLAYLKTSRRKDSKDFSKSISIISPALIGRWYFYRYNKFNFFLSAGVGPSYMSNDDFEGRDLGMRFAFQDIGGLGFHTKIARTESLSFAMNIIHYSNASLSSENRGITIPFSMRFAYRF